MQVFGVTSCHLLQFMISNFFHLLKLQRSSSGFTLNNIFGAGYNEKQEAVGLCPFHSFGQCFLVAIISTHWMLNLLRIFSSRPHALNLVGHSHAQTKNKLRLDFGNYLTTFSCMLWAEGSLSVVKIILTTIMTASAASHS